MAARLQRLDMQNSFMRSSCKGVSVLIFSQTVANACLFHLHRLGCLIRAVAYEMRAGCVVAGAVEHGAHAHVAVASSTPCLLVVPE